MKQWRMPYLLYFICLVLVAAIVCTPSQSDKINGTLRVSKINPRYFTNDLGKAVYLTGSHTWNNLVDMSPGDPPEKFDFDTYLQWMKKYNHNFIRLWAWELFNWDTRGNKEEKSKNHNITPHPWLRTGPGDGLDGKLKFDLNKMNPEYFNRLAHRVKCAADNGIYVSIMLFEGWGLQFSPDAFRNHPFHPENNINGINGDADHDGKGIEIHSLVNDKITTIQKNYITRVIETVNKFDNVLFEISNENHPLSTDWQYHLISYIKDHEKKMPKQHPVGMTFQYKGGDNQILFASPADWISPNLAGGYRDNPPPADGSKIILTDTDHLWGIGGNMGWVWKSFLRGLNPIFMDPYECQVLARNFDSSWVEPVRKSMGYTLMYANKMDLIHMIPEPELASSRYCLANKGIEYLVYLPEGQGVSVDLREAPGSFETEWFHPNKGEFKKSEDVKGGKEIWMTSLFGDSDVVLYLKIK